MDEARRQARLSTPGEGTPTRRRHRGIARTGDGAARLQCPLLNPHPQARPHHRRPGRRRSHPPRTRQRSHPVPQHRAALLAMTTPQVQLRGRNLTRSSSNPWRITSKLGFSLTLRIVPSSKNGKKRELVSTRRRLTISLLALARYASINHPLSSLHCLSSVLCPATRMPRSFVGRRTPQSTKQRITRATARGNVFRWPQASTIRRMTCDLTTFPWTFRRRPVVVATARKNGYVARHIPQ